MTPAVLAQSFGFAVFLGVLLFLPAGRIDWWQGWAFIVIFSACSLATGYWLAATNPGLPAEHRRSPTSRGQTPRDRAIVLALLISVFAWTVFMPLDSQRFHWSPPIPVWLQVVGGALIVLAFWAWSRVLRANSFAVTTIRVQEERAQTVISTGPYAVVRHPMYADALLLFIGAPLLLGSLWGLLGLVVIIPILAARTLGEEALLFEGLPGYRDYAARVRFRLIPGVW
jgi:protein-S-isoprenylcysteine O-methyltransferase Ste14